MDVPDLARAREWKNLPDTCVEDVALTAGFAA